MASQDIVFDVEDELSDPSAIGNFLTLLEENQIPVRLSPENSDCVFTTYISKCEPKKAIFEVGALKASNSTSSLTTFIKPDISYTLEAIYEGYYHACYGISLSGYIATSEANKKNSFYFSSPSLIIRQQRRQSFRITVPRSLNNRIAIRPAEIISSSPNTFTGRILDISMTGIACELMSVSDNMTLENIFSISNQEFELELDIDDVLETSCVGILKEIKSSPAKNIHRFGFQFSNLGARTERLINKAVVDIQRLTRKNQTRDQL